MALSPLSATVGVNRSITESRDLLSELQGQLASGKKVQSYGDLDIERAQILSFRAEISQIKAYGDTISQTNIRLDVLQQTLERIREIGAEAKSEALDIGFELQAGGQTMYQQLAAAQFDEVVALMNTDVAGRHLYGGRNTELNPVVPSAEILDGADTRAGFKQIVSERRQADLGADGRGRLIIPVPAADTVSVTEDAVGSPFGFKLAAATSTLTGTTVTGPAGAPANIDVTFTATLPQDGETITLTLDLPDGTNTDITLTAVAGTPLAPNEFGIGIDELTTATNFQAVLDGLIQTEAQISLSAASLFEASDNFFDFDGTTLPRRVDGPPFDSATALRDATATDTVFWYQGEISTSPARESAVAKADDAVLVPYGARANEDAFRTVLKQLAAVSVETFSTGDANANNRYDAITQRAAAALAFPGGTQSVDSIITEMTIAADAARQRLGPPRRQQRPVAELCR